jgi:hypothetical protein
MIMVDWLRFDVADDVMYVHILVGRLIEIQPDSLELTDEFCRDLYPVLDKIQELCIEKNLKQVCTSDLTGIDVTRIRPIPLMRMIWNVYEHTKDRILLSGFKASGADPFVKTLVDSVRGFLPPFMRNLIQVNI